MVEVFEDLQTLLDDFMALLALDVRDEADATGVVSFSGSYMPCAAGAEPRVGGS